jgi:hypothetical protein
MMRSISIIIISGILVLTSCRSTKNIQTAIAKKDTVAAPVVVNDPHADSMLFISEAFQKLEKNKIEFETFSAKINTDYQGTDDKKYDLNVFLRMKKDSIIWISVNVALGIEGLRVIIDKDSVKIMNKLEKEYQVKSLDYLLEVAALPLDLHTMQQLLIGNPVFIDSNIKSYSLDGDLISMLCESEWFKHLITIQNNDHLVLHSKLDDVDAQRSRTCFLNYADYETKNGISFSTLRSISVTEKTKLDVKLHFKQYEFNETLSFPFSIPKNYKKKP